MSIGGENWKPYRPSNGSEGDCFQAAWCERCLRDKAARAGDYANGCDILLRALAFPIPDPAQLVLIADPTEIIAGLVPELVPQPKEELCQTA